jgi:deoxyribodipyrimidine photolyase
MKTTLRKPMEKGYKKDRQNVAIKVFTFIVIVIFAGINMSFGYPHDLKSEIILVFNTLTGKSCNHLYDTANALYESQANKYSMDITPISTYEKIKKICSQNRLVCSEDNDELLFDVKNIENKKSKIAKSFQRFTIDFYTKNRKDLITKCSFVVNTEDTNRGYPISFPEISKNLRQCISDIENKECAVDALSNIYTVLETVP